MLVRFTKAVPAAKGDLLTCVRLDGTRTQGEMTRQGILPHEAFHFVLESTMRWHDGFFGHLARGAGLDELTAMLHGRSKGRSSNMTQALQSEALVDCLQSEQWAGATHPADFAEKLVATCRRRSVAPPDITPEELDRVRVALREFGAQWRPLAPGASLERTFGP